MADAHRWRSGVPLWLRRALPVETSVLSWLARYPYGSLAAATGVLLRPRLLLRLLLRLRLRRRAGLALVLLARSGARALRGGGVSGSCSAPCSIAMTCSMSTLTWPSVRSARQCANVLRPAQVTGCKAKQKLRTDPRRTSQSGSGPRLPPPEPPSASPPSPSRPLRPLESPSWIDRSACVRAAS